MIEIAGRRLGAGAPAFVIAEAGINHNGDISLAERLVDAAASSGADAVKFQTFSARRLCAASAATAAYQRAAGSGDAQIALLEPLELDEPAHRRLIARAAERKILFLSTPFDDESADLLDRLGLPAFKIASGEVTNLPFLRRVASLAARRRVPVLLSTGMSDLDEVRAAVAAVRAGGDPPLAVLHCVSCYPAADADSNLRAIPALAEALGPSVVVGWSDHTPGIEVALAAVALGARVVEKHLTLEKSMPGPDHAASLDPGEFAVLVRGIRRVEASLGDGAKRPRPAELPTRAAARKSLVAARDLPAGATLSAADLVAKRPGTGIPPAEVDRVVGRRLARAVRADEILRPEDLS